MNHRMLLGGLCLLTLMGCKDSRSFDIDKTVLADKIRGAWAGQAIGCTYGGPTEFRYQGTVIADSINIEWTDGQMEWYYNNSPGLYDDLYMDLTFVDVIHREGLDAPVESFAKAYADAGYPLWHANQAGRYNIHRGIMPPASGYWLNNPHADDIDYQIEADYAGIMCPGMPNTASDISDKIGHIMNYGDGWYGGVFVGAMYAEAFRHTDVRTVVDEALRTIPEQSRFFQCMKDVITWHDQYPSDWHRTWQLVEEKWADEMGCPDGVKSPFDIDALINSAYIIIGLLYGEGDFSRTLEISTRCGQDSDCNPASAGGILGCMLGYENIPAEWTKNLKAVEERDFAYTTISLSEACQYSMEAAEKLILANGGRDLGKAYRVKGEKPLPVRLEQSFEGLKVIEVRGGQPISDICEETFTGCGIVVSGYVSNAPADYVAEVVVTVDGVVKQTMRCPADFHERTTELCWMYDLNEGDHLLHLLWLNRVEGIQLQSTRVIVYGSAEYGE
ncbi:MAG: ADP-ribosylglycohydrolase family protein [Bacteroidales bacterium]|nr:ADP-ribosylglycohydrolase family protein [Bacteroidales bacterium]